jgi:hypothetical protein
MQVYRDSCCNFIARIAASLPQALLQVCRTFCCNFIVSIVAILPQVLLEACREVTARLPRFLL